MLNLLKKTTFNENYDRNSNSIDIIRLFLALIVLYGHTYAVIYGTSGMGPKGQVDLFAIFTKGQLGSGTLAVYIFFIISGFLIAQSMLNSKTYIEYLIKRALRLMPALFSCLVLTVFIIGPIVTQLSLADYFNSEINPFKYFFYNLTFGIFGFYYNIADVFSTNPFQYSINASLWTLPVELLCYIIVMLLSLLTILKRRKIVLHLYILNVLLVYLYYKYGYIPIQNKSDHWWMLSAVYIVPVIRLCCFFMSGVVIYCYKDKILFNKGILAILSIILLVTIRKGYLNYSIFICLPYVTMYICLLKPFFNLRKIGDFSYGVYVYAFPIQQFLAFYLYEKLAFLPFLALSTICILLVSVISWYFIEKPALNFKKKLSKGMFKKKIEVDKVASING